MAERRGSEKYRISTRRRWHGRLIRRSLKLLHRFAGGQHRALFLLRFADQQPQAGVETLAGVGEFMQGVFAALGLPVEQLFYDSFEFSVR